jgi:hypothetical protein
MDRPFSVDGLAEQKKKKTSSSSSHSDGDWIFTVRVPLRLAVYQQSVHLGVKPLETHDQSIYFSTEHLRFLRNILSDDRMDLSFTIAAGPRQSSHSQLRVLRDSWPHFTVSDWRLPQPGGPGPRIYIPQEQGGPVIGPGTGFHFRRLVRLAGLRWRYSTPPPRLDKMPTQTEERALNVLSQIFTCFWNGNV